MADSNITHDTDPAQGHTANEADYILKSSEFLVEGKIKLLNVTELNEYKKYSVFMSGLESKTGDKFSHFLNSSESGNIFDLDRPDPIDPSTVDGKVWNGIAIVERTTSQNGKDYFIYKAISLDVQHGPTTMQQPRAPKPRFETNPLMRRS